MTMSSSETLLGPAALLLRGHGFVTQPVTLVPGLTLLLAENDFFVVGLVEFATPVDLSSVESASAAEFAARLSDGGGAKRWDAYLVLLSPAALAGDVMPESVTTIVYNTRFLRRIVRWNVGPDEDSLSRALRPFLPLTSAEAGEQSSPLDRLAGQLPSYGISSEDALQALAEWRMTGARDG
jgi:hypothetical protein